MAHIPKNVGVKQPFMWEKKTGGFGNLNMPKIDFRKPINGSGSARDQQQRIGDQARKTWCIAEGPVIPRVWKQSDMIHGSLQDHLL